MSSFENNHAKPGHIEKDSGEHFIVVDFIVAMVRKRVKRKATAASSASALGVVENNEKGSAQVYNEDLTNVTPVTPDREVPHNDFDMYLKEHVRRVSDKPASEKVTTVFSSALNS